MRLDTNGTIGILLLAYLCCAKALDAAHQGPYRRKRTLMNLLRRRKPTLVIGQPPIVQHPPAPINVEITATNLQMLELEPGDMLLLTTDVRLTREGAEYIKAKVAEGLPGIKVLIVSDGMQATIVRPGLAQQIEQVSDTGTVDQSRS